MVFNFVFRFKQSSEDLSLQENRTENPKPLEIQSQKLGYYKQQKLGVLNGRQATNVFLLCEMFRLMYVKNKRHINTG
jgi:hypothetical protein